MQESQEYEAPKTHAELKRMVEQFLTMTASNTAQVERDRDYYDGDQISSSVLAELKKRGQPPIHTNKIAPAVRGMLGIIDAASSDPQAYPRNVHHADAADVATKVLRYLSDRADLKRLWTQVSEQFIIDGYCAAIVAYEDDEVTATRIHREDFIFDPLSREHDFSDAKFLGSGALVDREDVGYAFPDFSGVEIASDDIFGMSDSQRQFWAMEDRKQVRVIDLYYQCGGAWHRAVFTGSQMLHESLSEYANEAGQPICPIVAATYEVSRKGDRYGAVRDMRPLQDEVNARRSRLLHLTNHRQVRQTTLETPATNVALAQKEASKANGVIPFGFEAIPAPDLAQGQMLILQQSMADLDRMAPTPAVLGRLSGANESGRARQVLQQAGYTELARAFGRLEAMQTKLYRKLWLAARQYLTEPRWVRVTSDPRALEFLQINEPVMGQTVQPVVNPETGEPVVDPYTGQPAVQVVEGVVGYNNRIAELDVDIILSTAPDSVTLEQETFATIMEYATGTGITPDDPRFVMLVEISPLANRREIIERIEASKAKLAEQQGGPDPMQVEAMKVELDAKAASTERDRAKAFLDITKAQSEQATSVRAGLGLSN